MRSMIYPVPVVAVPSPAPAPLVEVRLTAAGKPVVAWLAETNGTPRPLVLFFHGNAENLETLRQSGLFGDFARVGADVLAVDYPGYGRSAGEPSEAGNLEAAVAALEWAVRERPGRKRVVAGWSLGAAVAIQLAARHSGDLEGLVLMSPWTALPDLAREHYPSWMVGAFLHERYDSISAAAAVRCPTLVLHGAADSIIPMRHGEALSRALGVRARFVAVPGAGHNDLLAEPDVWRAIRGFLSERG